MLPIARVGKSRILRNHTLWTFMQSERGFQTSPRSMKQLITKSMRMKHEDYFKRIDQVPDEYEMVYKLPLHYTLNGGKMVTLSTTIAVPLAYFYNTISEIGISEMNFISSVAADRSELLFFIGALAISNAFLYRCCHITIPRIYRHEKNYIAIVPSLIPRFNKKIYFEKGDMKENFKAISMFQGVTYKIKDSTALIVADRFRRATDLYEMLHESDSMKYKIN